MPVTLNCATNNLTFSYTWIKLWSHLNARFWKYRSIVDKGLRELWPTILTRCNFLFGDSVIETSKFGVLSLEQFPIGWPPDIFPSKHVIEGNTCWRKSHIGFRINFNRISSSRQVNSMASSQGNVSTIRYWIWIPNLGLGHYKKHLEIQP